MVIASLVIWRVKGGSNGALLWYSILSHGPNMVRLHCSSRCLARRAVSHLTVCTQGGRTDRFDARPDTDRDRILDKIVIPTDFHGGLTSSLCTFSCCSDGFLSRRHIHLFISLGIRTRPYSPIRGGSAHVDKSDSHISAERSGGTCPSETEARRHQQGLRQDTRKVFPSGLVQEKSLT